MLCLAAVTLGIFALAASAASGSIITVNTTLDETTSGDGLCSLREAITNANDNGQTYSDCAPGSGDDTITFSVSGTITLGSTLPAIASGMGALTIDGSGQTNTISGNNLVGVFFINSGAILTLQNITIANGRGEMGGGVLNIGTLNVLAASPSDADGSGSILGPQGGQATFSFDVALQQIRQKTRGVGSLDYSDPAAGLSFQSNKITSLTLSGNQIHFTGIAKVGRRSQLSYTVDATDNGPTGTLDTFSIQVSNGYTAGGNLTSGDNSIH
jgi:CSLREA domain-containing protein